MKRIIRTKSADIFFDKKFKNKKFKKTYEEISPLLDIAMVITKARNKIGLSQAELAKKLKTTQSVISRIENGNQNISLNMLAKIAQVLDCHLSVKLTPHKLAA